MICHQILLLNINIMFVSLQLQAELREYRPTVDGSLETSALGLTFRVTKQGGIITRAFFCQTCKCIFKLMIFIDNIFS